MKTVVRNSSFFKEIPSFRILVFFILGIVLADSVRQPSSSMAVIICIVTTTAFITSITKISYNNLIFSTIINTLFLLLGYSVSVISNPEFKQSHYLNYNNKQITAIGEIVDEPKLGKSLRVMLKIKKIKNHDDIWFKSSGNLLTYLPKGVKSDSLKAGDLLLINSTLHPLQDNQNPLAFDYKSYLYYKGIRDQSFIRANEWEYIGQSELNSIQSIARKLRQQSADILRKYIKDEDNLAIASAMLLGLRNNLSEEIYQAYTDTGAVHVLAVSGLHVGYINIILMFLLSLFLKGSKTLEIIRAVLIILGIWLFALITGAAPAVLRAATMFSMLTVGIIIFKKYNIYNILASSAFVLLIFDASLLFQGSFQFSYLALFSILYWQPKLMSLIYIQNKYLKKLVNLLLVAVAAQVLVFPVTILYFHKFASSFLISGVVAIVFAAFVIWGCLLLIAGHIVDLGCNYIGFSVSYLVDAIAYLLNWILTAFIYIIKSIQALPYSNIDKLWIEPYEMMLIYLVLALIMLWISFRQPRSLFGILGILIILSAGRIKKSIEVNNQAEIICYDVQKALAVDFISGNRAYSFATLPEEHKLLRFARDNYRMHKGVNEIDVLNPNKSEQNEIKANNGILRFRDKTIAIAHDTLTAWQYIDSMDILLIGQVNTYNIAQKLKDKKINHIVINHNMNNFKIQQLKDDLEALSNHIHYVGNEAFILKIDHR